MVQPFASLPQFAREGVPRVLFNKDIVGDLGSRADDVIVLGDCDEGVRKLADALGWRDELEAMWMEVSGKVQEKEAARLREARKNMSKDEILEAEIEKLTGEVESVLKLSKDHLEKSSSADKSPSATPDTSSDSDIQKSKASTLTISEAGWKEPPSTPADANNTPINADRVTTDSPAQAPKVGSQAIPDMTMPQNRPDKESADSDRGQMKPTSWV